MIRLFITMTIVLGACSSSNGDQTTAGPDQTAGSGGSPTGGIGGAGAGGLPTGGIGGAGAGGLPISGTGGTGGGGSPAGGSGEPTCSPKCSPECDPACEACTDGKWIERIEGRVVDDQANPLPGADAVLCVYQATGLENCLNPTQTDATGAFEVTIPDEARCINSAVLGVMLIGTDRTFSYCHLDLPDMQSSVSIEQPFILFQTTRATVLPPAGDLAVEQTVVFADGLELDVTPQLFYSIGGAYADLAVRRLAPDTGGLCFLQDPGTIIAVYGFSPTGDIGEAGFPVRIPNATSLPAGTDVALYVLGGLSCQLSDNTWVAEGDWVQYGTGKVSADGLIIEGDPVPCLYWLGYGPLT
jgi:hypothetical protein